ncbi:NADH-quinone oxidoreductase subunit J [Marinivivus vitaminiproducens]|uniref:NADH-quinone oxidoreductase subunit J n=1 Tax=Marinivivus vitaminiproducens TaxID=3035935 RepID=UPI00279F2737|nr:NADH-quinone oxidoreductase subunit J [Geminicoccaceae bacterium SCSIO 64248]
MSLPLLIFFIFAAITVASGVMVISARNPVHSVLFLILAFFNSAALFVLLGAEFLAMILVVVYVGAVAVLFMFVVMMLNINVVAVREGFLQYLPVGALIGLILLVELLLVGGTWVLSPEITATGQTPIPPPDITTNTAAIGAVLYTDYFYLFQLAGLILLVAIVGAIALTLRHRVVAPRRQNVAAQVYRRRAEAIEVRRVTPGSGV